MNSLRFGAAFVLMVWTVGCGDDGGGGTPDAGGDDFVDARVSPMDDAGNVEAVGYLAVSWNLTQGPTDTTTAPCPGDTVEVVSERVGGTQFIDLFDCADGSGTTAYLPLGDYDVWVNIRNGNSLVAQSFAQPATIDLPDQTVPVSFDIAVDGGFFAFTWSLTDDTQTLTCEEVGAGAVSLLSTLVGPNTATDDIYDCADGEGITGKLDLGDYAVIVSLLDAVDDSPLASSEPRDASLDHGNELSDLGNFEFVFAP